MTTGIGFKIDEQLLTEFAASVNTADIGVIPLLQLQIQDELVVLRHKGSNADIEQAFEDMKTHAGSEPSFFVLRNPNTISEWIMVNWMPEGANVKEKMIYASSRNALKRDLGQAFTVEISATDVTELDFTHHDIRASKEDAMTATEILEQEDKMLERDSHADSRTKSRLAFPLDQPAIDAIQSFGKGYNLVRLRVNTMDEIIELEEKTSASVTELPNPGDRPMFCIYKYEHAVPGSDKRDTKTLFWLSCPLNAKVKEKMLSATLKSTLAKYLEQNNVSYDKQFDTDNDAEDLDETSLLSQLYTNIEDEQVAPTVSKASKPSGRGNRRMVGGARKKLADLDD